MQLDRIAIRTEHLNTINSIFEINSDIDLPVKCLQAHLCVVYVFACVHARLLNRPARAQPIKSKRDERRVGWMWVAWCARDAALSGFPLNLRADMLAQGARTHRPAILPTSSSRSRRAGLQVHHQHSCRRPSTPIYYAPSEYHLRRRRRRRRCRRRGRHFGRVDAFRNAGTDRIVSPQRTKRFDCVDVNETHARRRAGVDAGHYVMQNRI